MQKNGYRIFHWKMVKSARMGSTLSRTFCSTRAEQAENHHADDKLHRVTTQGTTTAQGTPLYERFRFVQTSFFFLPCFQQVRVANALISPLAGSVFALVSTRFM